LDEAEALVDKWIALNAAQLMATAREQVCYEVGFLIYRDRRGCLKTTDVTVGGSGEIRIPGVQADVVAVVHTHPEGCELSDYDAAQLQHHADGEDHPILGCVVGVDPEEGVTSECIAFWPGGEEPEN